MDFKKLWPSLIAALPTVIAPFYTDIIAWVASNPQISMFVMSMMAIVANIAQSPKVQDAAKSE